MASRRAGLKGPITIMITLNERDVITALLLSARGHRAPAQGGRGSRSHASHRRALRVGTGDQKPGHLRVGTRRRGRAPGWPEIAPREDRPTFGAVVTWEDGTQRWRMPDWLGGPGPTGEPGKEDWRAAGGSGASRKG